jgi:hypothetical protein
MAGLAQASSNTRRLDLERRAFFDLLKMANTLTEPKAIAQQLVILAQHLSGCEAVAIRLKSGPGFPYAAHLGFSERFVTLEDELCATDEDGHMLRNESRQPILACLCGRVLSHRVDRGQAFFTDRGSFVTSSTSSILASPSEAQCLGKTRSRCHASGYETVGLFPIRRDDVTYGLIQCNDPQRGKLKAESIDLMENLAATAAHLFQLAMA